MRKITILSLFLGTMTALILLQNLALEKSPEQVREKSRTQLSDLPAKDMVPTYISTLFLGSFRALAIDVFWIQLKEAQDERRWYQAREIMEMISKLQPHNEEVWSMLAWDSAYNIANSEEQISYERAWKWIRYGLLKLREGIRVNPRSPYLTFELARILQHKPSWKSGSLDDNFLSHVLQDEELQKELALSKGEEKKSAFELSLLWFEETIRRLTIHREEESVFFRTQMGLYLHQDTMEGFLRDTKYLQAVYCWRKARREGAASPFWKKADLWIQRAQTQSEEMSGKFVASSVSEEQAAFYAEVRQVFQKSHAFHQSRTGETLKPYVRALEKVMIQFGPIDGGFLQNALSEVRQTLSLEEYGPRRGNFIDRNEFNDSHPFASSLEEEVPLYGNLLPQGDVDSFFLLIPAPGVPILHLTRIGQTNLEITLSLGNGVPFLKREITEEKEVRIPLQIQVPGRYHIDIRAIGPKTSDSRYRIEIEKIPSQMPTPPKLDHHGHDH